jgi:hypothetical protein
MTLIESKACNEPSGNVLVIYSLMDWPLKSTVKDHLRCFKHHSAGRVFYLNLPLASPPRWIRSLKWDVVVYHTSFLSTRWIPELFDRNCKAAAPLRDLAPVSVALPQDEFIYADRLTEFISEFRVENVLSVIPVTEVATVFPGVDRSRTSFGQVLTGYLSEETLSRVGQILDESTVRQIDIGYRAWEGAPWLGRHGMLKREISEAVTAAAPRLGLVADCSTRGEDTFFGDDWFRFLARCRFVLGVEGGASIVDRDGQLKIATEKYLESNPDASFDEIEAACFPGRDGEVEMFVLTPRNLEACATRTAQILVRGNYNGVLRPGVHYIELEPDFSNLDEVLAAVESDEIRERIVDRAYDDIVASGLYTYLALVDEVERSVLGHRVYSVRDPRAELFLRLNRMREVFSWAEVIARAIYSAWATRLSLAGRSLLRHGVISCRSVLRRARRSPSSL